MVYNLWWVYLNNQSIKYILADVIPKIKFSKKNDLQLTNEST